MVTALSVISSSLYSSHYPSQTLQELPDISQVLLFCISLKSTWKESIDNRFGYKNQKKSNTNS